VFKGGVGPNDHKEERKIESTILSRRGRVSTPFYRWKGRSDLMFDTQTPRKEKRKKRVTYHIKKNNKGVDGSLFRRRRSASSFSFCSGREEHRVVVPE